MGLHNSAQTSSVPPIMSPSCLSNQSSQTRKGFQALEFGDFRKGMGLPCGLLLESSLDFGRCNLGLPLHHSFHAPTLGPIGTSTFSSGIPLCRLVPGSPTHPELKPLVCSQARTTEASELGLSWGSGARGPRATRLGPERPCARRACSSSLTLSICENFSAGGKP